MVQQKKLNINGKYLVIGFVVLILIIGAAMWYNLSHHGADDDGFSLSIARDGKVLKTFTLQDIKKMPGTEVYADLQSAKHDNAKGNFKGVEMRTLLNQADKSLAMECSTFICIAGDGYSSAVSSKELLKKKNVLIAYEKDGVPFTHFNDGGEGPMRTIIASDTYGNRSTKYLVRIECKK